jgi:histidinol-phosphate phosphatase family protein
MVLSEFVNFTMINKKINLTQAVILCGGLGTRLRPLTDNLPKPMVSINGKPFLYHLLTQLAEQGFKRFLLLTGFLSEKISNYFGDGSQYGWSITYSDGPTDWDTGRRLWEARENCDKQFLLLYSDNFVQFSAKKLKHLHVKLRTQVTLLLAPKEKGNIKVSGDGKIQAYDKHRYGKDFNYVEVGYMIIDRAPFFYDFPFIQNFPDFNLSELLQQYAQKKKLGGLVVHDHYHSISDPRRLNLMCKYLKPKKILLIDRDGTLNEKAPQGQYISNWSQFKWIPSTLEALKILAKDGFQFIVITNQAGIARKMLEPKKVEEIHQQMTLQLGKEGVRVLKVYMSPHHWNENSFMRKPAPGMFFKAAKDFNLRMDRTLYIGDDERDCVAAKNAGCGMVYLAAETKNQQHQDFTDIFFYGNSLLENVIKIKNCYSIWEKSS